MIKIAVTVRNRLAVTKKCLEALKRHSEIPHQIYIYDNLTNYKVQEHFDYFRDLWINGEIQQVTFNTKASTFNAFSKASSLNSFGKNHEQDPNGNKCDYILFIDNDAIVMPGWDLKLSKAWEIIKKRKKNNIIVLGQARGGGIKYAGKNNPDKLAGMDYKLGKLGGSYFWSVRPNFFKEVGYLDLSKLVGKNKKHDQNYWTLLDRKANGNAYIAGLRDDLVLDSGGFVGSICNVLAQGENKEKLEKAKYKESEKKVESLSFEEFYNKMLDKNKIVKNRKVKKFSVKNEKEKAIICTHVGEMGWEILRFAPYVLWHKIKKYGGNVKLIVQTRPDRFDLYGQNADILIPLNINGDYSSLNSDCFRLTGLSDKKYIELINKVKRQYSDKYDIVENIYPIVKGKRYTEKNQFKTNQMFFEFTTRHSNKKFIYDTIPNDKPLITIAPRYRKFGKKRNWPHWQKFYDEIEQKLNDKYYFILCGKQPEYIPDEKNRFFDINKMIDPKIEDLSLIGITIEALKRSIVCVGSQSGIPNLSNLVCTPTIQWGNQKKSHSKLYNVKNTKTIFIDDPEFKIESEKILTELTNFLNKRGK